MPSIYQGTCGKCGHSSGGYSDTALAMLLEREHPATSLEANRHHLLDDVGELGSPGAWCLLVLPHPCEESTLNTTGYTFERMAREGRAVRLTPAVCRGCGTVYHRRELRPSSGMLGCVVGLASGIAVGIAVGLWSGHVTAGLGVGWAAMMAVLLIDWLVERLRLLHFRDRARSLARPASCPTCGSRSAQ